MTVCLAALCHDDTFVAISDRMVTLGDLAEYEIWASKMTILPTHGVCILMADDMNMQGEILALLRDIVMPTETEIAHDLDVLKVARHYHRIAHEVHTQREQEHILRRHMLTREQWINEQQKLDPTFITKVMDDLDNIDEPPVSAIIAGYDARNRPQIFCMYHGKLTFETSNGFSAIGSGRWHATSAMMDYGFVKGAPVVDGLFDCFTAKKRAETARGVGRSTNLIYYDRQGWHRLDTWDEISLEQCYAQMEKQHTAVRHKFRDKFDDERKTNEARIKPETKVTLLGE